MPTLFTRILQGELPGRFVWKDDLCGAFLSIHPIRPGHTLVVPRAEVDHWLDLDPAILAHCTQTAQHIGRAQQRAFAPARVGLMLAGFEVPHTHLHVVPTRHMGDLDFDNADMRAKPEDLDSAAEALRAALRALGHTHVVP